MKRTVFLFTLLTAVLTAVTPLQAQRGGGMGMGMGGSMNSVFGPAFGKEQNFSAKAEISTRSSSASIIDSLPMEFAYSAGKVRMEMNMGEAKGAQFSASTMQQIKAMGMDKTTYIVREDQQKMLMVYPNMNAYVEMPLPGKKDDKEKEKEPKIEKTEVGKETVDGHPCVKNKLVITDEATGKSHEMFLWNATDLKDFPVKIETADGGMTTTFTYKDVKFDKPADKLFEAPEDAKKYANMQEMMMEKMGGGAGGFGGRGGPPVKK